MRKWVSFGLVATCLLLIAMERPQRPVSLKGMKFSPAMCEIKVGDSVRWTNDDDRDHTITATDGSFSSGNLKSGEAFEHKFDKAGKFAYSCSYHPRMKGAVNVSE